MPHQVAGSPGRSQRSAQETSVPSRLTIPNGQTWCQNFPPKMTLHTPSGGCLLLTQQISTAKCPEPSPPNPAASPHPGLCPQEQHVQVQPSVTGRTCNSDPNISEEHPNHGSRAACHHFKRGSHRAYILGGVPARRRIFA